ncbi:MAG: aspartate-semialdehyde dehydrogenase [Candidatus Levybacteria bacterium]|nr:aspartate-semialdehyde dehydrogenase [Candidatus Levybacteria bacterium]
MRKIPVGILGATGMVGQRFVTLLKNHPWFEVVILAASPRSAGKTYQKAVGENWRIDAPMPAYSKKMKVYAVEKDEAFIAKKVRLVFCALDMEKDEIRAIEDKYAQKGIVVVSNNSANRWTTDVPMIIPEINPDHTDLIKIQRKRRGWKGLIVVKPNCSVQSYIPIIHALREFGPRQLEVTTLQAVSGAGKTFTSWPEMLDNAIPFISAEEEKTEKEPLKILGSLTNESIKTKNGLQISATCIRVAVTDGHMVSVAAKFKKKPTLAQIIRCLKQYKNPIAHLNLPSSPSPFIHYFAEEDRPQTNLDRDLGNGMAISCGRFREDPIFDWKFVSLSHNTIRGAAGGAILTAELLLAKKLI